MLLVGEDVLARLLKKVIPGARFDALPLLIGQDSRSRCLLLLSRAALIKLQSNNVLAAAFLCLDVVFKNNIVEKPQLLQPGVALEVGHLRPQGSEAVDETALRPSR